MNRRGSLEWNLETIGKLLIGVAVLAIVVILAMKLVGLFTGGFQEDIGIKSLHLLENRIAHVSQDGTPSSAVLHVFDNTLLVGFDAREPKVFERADAAGLSVLCETEIPRPKSCDDADACLCSLRLTVENRLPHSCLLPQALACVSFDGFYEISGTIEPIAVDTRAFSADIGKFDIDFLETSDVVNGGYTDYFAMGASMGPRNVRVAVHDKTILLDTGAAVAEERCQDETGRFIGCGGSFGGAGATSSY